MIRIINLFLLVLALSMLADIREKMDAHPSLACASSVAVMTPDGYATPICQP